MDVSQILTNTGVQLEQNALYSAGAAVEDFSRGQSPQSVINGSGLYSPTTPYMPTGGNSLLSLFNPFSGGFKQWQSTRYAADMIPFAPKHRFMFKVQFVFTAPYQVQNGGVDVVFTYVVKAIDKPKVTFDYEDVNMYNFRTQVLKAIKHEPLNMSFHDDIRNSVVTFFNEYRKAHSPISNMTVEQAATFEEGGMNFESPEGSSRGYSASRGILKGGEKHVLKQIKLKQIFGHGTALSEFIFVNPRIMNFDFDNVDHEAGADGSSVSVQFGYDSLYLEESTMLGTPEPRWGQSDVFGNGKSPSSFSPFGSMATGALKPFVDPIMGAARQIAYGTINEKMGQFGLTRNPLSTALTMSTISVFSTVTNTTLNSVTNGVNQGSAGINNAYSPGFATVNDSYRGSNEVVLRGPTGGTNYNERVISPPTR